MTLFLKTWAKIKSGKKWSFLAEYIRDNVNVYLFADDAKLYTHTKSEQDELCKDSLRDLSLVSVI